MFVILGVVYSGTAIQPAFISDRLHHLYLYDCVRAPLQRLKTWSTTAGW